MDSIANFITYLSSEKKYAKHTIIAYENDLHQFYDFVGATFEVYESKLINYSFIRNWVVQLKEHGLQNKSINRKISALQMYFKYEMINGRIDVSPLAKHRSLKVGKREEIPFSEKEIEAVLNCFEEDFSSSRNRLIIELLYTTGMRRGELINLKDASFDFSNQQLKVVGKRNKERIIPLIPEVMHRAMHYKEQKNTVFESTCFFVDDHGKPITASYVYQVVNLAFSKASSKLKRSPHILRHSFATHMLNNGANLTEVKELLGHASLASTQVYAHNSIAKLKAVHAKSHPRSTS